LFLIGLTSNKEMLLLIINLLLLVAGMFLDSCPAILLLAPMLAPAVFNLGVHPVQFGLIICLNLAIGLMTPPVGTALYVVSNISKLSIGRIVKSMLPFWLVMVIVLLLVTYIPVLTTYVVANP
jgi:C4-dicarboxylate transporter DctM subunit